MSKILKGLMDPKEGVRYVMRKMGFTYQDYKPWSKRGFAPPSPHFIKLNVLLRNGLDGAVWVETGTHTGTTTRVLSTVAKHVYSIEPEPTFFSRAAKMFANVSNVTIVRGLSEEIFPDLLPTLKGDVCFWLDGHYSGGVTFKGPQDTPIMDELAAIERNSGNMNRVVVMVDDMHCFGSKDPEWASYPSVNFLVDWARKSGMTWHIEHDIFVAKRCQL